MKIVTLSKPARQSRARPAVRHSDRAGVTDDNSESLTSSESDGHWRQVTLELGLGLGCHCCPPARADCISRPPASSSARSAPGPSPAGGGSAQAAAAGGGAAAAAGGGRPHMPA
jgi:hypothetical protein